MAILGVLLVVPRVRALRGWACRAVERSHAFPDPSGAFPLHPPYALPRQHQNKSIEWMAGVRDEDAEFAGGRCQAPIERDEGRIEAPGNREMQRVRCSEP